jgi:hypothetical protein
MGLSEVLPYTAAVEEKTNFLTPAATAAAMRERLLTVLFR